MGQAPFFLTGLVAAADIDALLSDWHGERPDPPLATHDLRLKRRLAEQAQGATPRGGRVRHAFQPLLARRSYLLTMLVTPR
jgi:hypothetical protein